MTKARDLRKLSDEELATFWAGWKPNTKDWILADMELKRRLNRWNEWRGWIAIAISVVALVVAALKP